MLHHGLRDLGHARDEGGPPHWLELRVDLRALESHRPGVHVVALVRDLQAVHLPLKKADLGRPQGAKHVVGVTFWVNEFLEDPAAPHQLLVEQEAPQASLVEILDRRPRRRVLADHGSVVRLVALRLRDIVGDDAGGRGLAHELLENPGAVHLLLLLALDRAVHRREVPQRRGVVLEENRVGDAEVEGQAARQVLLPQQLEQVRRDPIALQVGAGVAHHRSLG
mmetsp:Transcript_21149/g.60436  ORF Transcript_21149/g.60436 Transcript_21149/m.60436 type:complete len:223 (+) Transcript_21149:877-1545(+)